MIATHAIKPLSSTQQIIASISAEAELYVPIKCACQSIGLIGLAADFGINVQAQVG